MPRSYYSSRAYSGYGPKTTGGASLWASSTRRMVKMMVRLIIILSTAVMGAVNDILGTTRCLHEGFRLFKAA